MSRTPSSVASIGFNEVRGAGLDRLQSLLAFGERGDHDDRQVTALGQDGFGGLKAIHARHHDVHQHQVDVGFHELERFVSGLGHERLVAQSEQERRKNLAVQSSSTAKILETRVAPSKSSADEDKGGGMRISGQFVVGASSASAAA